MPSTASDHRYSLSSALQAYRMAQAIDRARDRAIRKEALQAILARLEAARIENAERYLMERLRRETSSELS